MKDTACDSLCYNLCNFLHIIYLFCRSVGNSIKLLDTTSQEVRLRPYSNLQAVLQVAISKF